VLVGRGGKRVGKGTPVRKEQIGTSGGPRDGITRKKNFRVRQGYVHVSKSPRGGQGPPTKDSGPICEKGRETDVEVNIEGKPQPPKKKAKDKAERKIVRLDRSAVTKLPEAYKAKKVRPRDGRTGRVLGSSM